MVCPTEKFRAAPKEKRAARWDRSPRHGLEGGEKLNTPTPITVPRACLAGWPAMAHWNLTSRAPERRRAVFAAPSALALPDRPREWQPPERAPSSDRKSTRPNSNHLGISYAV